MPLAPSYRPQRGPRCLPASLAVFTIAVLLASSRPAAAQDQGKNLPPELAAVPQDSFAFVYLRPAELWQSAPAARLRKHFPRQAADLVQSLLEGEDPAETESFIIAYPNLDGLNRAPLFDRESKLRLVLIETTVKPFHRAKVLERVLGKRAVEKNHQKRSYFESTAQTEDRLPGAVHFINDRTYLFTFTEQAMKKALAALDEPRGTTPLSPALEQARQKHHVVLGLDASGKMANELRRELLDDGGLRFRGGPEPWWTATPLVEVRSLAAAIDVGTDIRLDLDMGFPQARHAVNAAGAFEDAVVLLRLFAGSRIRAEIKSEIQRGIGPVDVQALVFAELLLTQLENSLNKAVVEPRQTTLKVQAQCPFDVAALTSTAQRQVGERIRDDFAIYHFRVAEIWKSDIAVKLRQLFPEIEEELFRREFRNLTEIGLTPANVESVTIVQPNSHPLFGTPRRTRMEKEFKSKRASGSSGSAADTKSIAAPPPVEKTDPQDPPLKNEFEDLKIKPRDDKKQDAPRPIDKKQDAPRPIDKKQDKFEQEVAFREGPAAEEVAFQPGRREDRAEDIDEQNEVIIVKVTTVNPYERTRVLKFISGKFVEKTYRDKTYYAEDRDRGFNSTAVHFIDERSFIVMTPTAWMPRVIDRLAEKTPVSAAAGLFQARGKLAEEVESALSKKHQIVVGVNLTEWSVMEHKKDLEDNLRNPDFRRDTEPFQSLLPLLEARTGFAVVDFGKEGVHARADVTFASPEQAAGSEQALRDGLAMARFFTFSMGRTELRREIQRKIDDRSDFGPLVYGNLVLVPGEKPAIKPKRDLLPMYFTDGLFARAEAILRKVKLEKQGDTLRLQAEGAYEPALLEAQGREAAVALIKGQQSEQLARRSAMNLERMMQAIHAYHDVYGKLPMSGNLSWRVHILPYMDELALYQEFKLDEPWDSAHNIKLLPRMPKVFATPASKGEPFTTHYQVFAGPGTVFDPKLQGKSIRNGIGIVETAESVAWTRPIDLAHDDKKPLPRLGVLPEGYHLIFMNGSTRFISPTDRGGKGTRFDEADIRRSILQKGTIDGGPEEFTK